MCEALAVYFADGSAEYLLLVWHGTTGRCGYEAVLLREVVTLVCTVGYALNETAFLLAVLVISSVISGDSCRLGRVFVLCVVPVG